MKKKHYTPIITLSLFMLIITFFGCEKNHEGKVLIDKTVSIAILDTEGNDLLNPDYIYDKSIDLKKLNIVYLINEKEQLMINSFKLITPEGHKKTYQLILDLNDKDQSNHTKTLLKWDNNSVDTLESSFIRENNNNYLVCNRINLNGKEVWNINTSKSNRDIIIIK